ncbi:MAG: hypothetical protein ACO4AU_02030 [bacterium]|jgi:hypothetical protein
MSRFILLLFLFWSSSLMAQSSLQLPKRILALPLPLVKGSMCPNKYSQQQKYCVPGTSAAFAVPRFKSSCPGGYSPAGKYCLGSKYYAVERKGSCPMGYSTSGQYCVGKKEAAYTVLKSGSCPLGYTVAGKYCLRRPEEGYAVVKRGSCPRGFKTEKGYCVRHLRNYSQYR